MSKKVDYREMIGRTYGRQTVLCQAMEKSKDGRTLCVCSCNCGTRVTVTAKNLRSGNTKSCGCLHREKSRETSKDMTGMEFGRLHVQCRAGTSAARTATWRCLCECGNECVVSGSYLRTGDTQSCGCLQRELNAQRSSKNQANMKFGKQTVLEQAKTRRKSRGVEWVCRCECGNICVAVCEDLCSGNTKSCGCLLSTGEMRIAEILSSYGVRYVRQMRFNDCRDIRALPFDFYLPEQKTAIEFQGQQHYDAVEHFGGEKAFHIRKRHDLMKKCYCHEQGIRLIEIRYDELDTQEAVLLSEIIINGGTNE